jgi:hypothetical protein
MSIRYIHVTRIEGPHVFGHECAILDEPDPDYCAKQREALFFDIEAHTVAIDTCYIVDTAVIP